MNREAAKSHADAMRRRVEGEEHRQFVDFLRARRRPRRWVWLVVPFIAAIPFGALAALLALWLSWFGLAVAAMWFMWVALWCALKAGLR